MKSLSFRLFKCVVLSLGLSAGSQAFAQLDKPEVERIDVVGEKTMPQLKRDFDKQRFAFLEMYNTINEVAKFDMLCEYRKPIGSQIARKLCEPRFVKDFRAMLIKTSSTKPGIDFNRLPDDGHVRFLTQDTREAAFEHVAALMATHPELLESFIKLDAIHQRIEERKNQ